MPRSMGGFGGKQAGSKAATTRSVGSKAAYAGSY